MDIADRTIRIDEFTVTVALLPAMPGARLAVRVAKIILPALARIAGEKGDLGSLSIATLGPAMGELFDRLSPEEFEDVARQLLKGATLRRDGQANAPDFLATMDAQLAGRSDVVVRAAIHAARVNFAGYFAAWAARAEALAQTQSPSATPSTSQKTGGSTT